MAVLVVAVAAPSLWAQGVGPFQYHAVTPCRVVDSRCATANPPSTCNNSGTPVTAFAPGAVTGCSAVPCPGNQTGSVAYTIQGNCGVPANARAVSLNFTIVSPLGWGYARLYPADATTMPVISSLNWLGGEGAIGNGAIVPLGASTPDIRVYVVQTPPASGPNVVNVVLDVTGYFCPPAGC